MPKGSILCVSKSAEPGVQLPPFLLSKRNRNECPAVTEIRILFGLSLIRVSCAVVSPGNWEKPLGTQTETEEGAARLVEHRYRLASDLIPQ
jgi:hypothetical protein